MISQPWGAAFDFSGNLYVANFYGGTVSKIDTNGTVTTFASGFDRPTALAFDTAGNLYVSVWGDNSIHKIDTNGTVTTFASGLNTPEGLAFDNLGDLFVSNVGNKSILKINTNGTTNTFAASLVNSPNYLAFDGNGNLYACIWANGLVLKLTPNGTVSTFVSGLYEPQQLAFDDSGNLFVANQGNGIISKITPNGTVSTFATNINGAFGLAFAPQAGPSSFTNQSVILDDFSTNSSANYNIIATFYYSGNYGISNGAFAPFSSGIGTTYYLRNTGEYLGAAGGQSVSIDIFALGTAVNGGYQDAAGLGFSTSLNSDQNGNELLLTQDNPGKYHLGSLGQVIGSYIPNGFSITNGPAILTITREATNPTLLTYSLTGGGLTQPAAQGTLSYSASAGLPVYFGMAVSYAPGDSTNSIREDNLRYFVQNNTTNTPVLPVITNPSFEFPYAGVVGWYFSYLRVPTNAGWIFTGVNGGNAGIGVNGSGWSAYQSVGTTNGNQYAFLQGVGGVGASMSQVISNCPSGSYSFSFTTSQRDKVGRDNTTNQTVTVMVDGTNVGSFTPADTNWYSCQTAPILLNEGDHTLTFTNVPVPGDATILIDNIGIQQGDNTDGFAQNITPFDAIPKKTFGDRPFRVKPPIASSGLPVTLAVVSGPAIILGDLVTLTGAGTVTLAADQGGNSNFAAAPEVFGIIDVKKLDQKLYFPEIQSRKLTVTPVELKARSSSGLPVSYSVFGPASVSDNFLTLTGTGKVTVIASLTESQNYNAAKPIARSFEVRRR